MSIGKNTWSAALCDDWRCCSNQDNICDVANPEEHGGSDGPRPRQYETAPSLHEHVSGAPGDCPGSIAAAFVSWTVLAAVSLSLGIPDLISEILDYLANSANVTTTAGRTPGSKLAFGGLVLVFGGLVLFFAFKMQSGRNWARITLVVLGALFCIVLLGVTISLLGIIISSPGDLLFNAVVAIVIVVFSALVSIVGIALMFRSTANAYFRASGKNR